MPTTVPLPIEEKNETRLWRRIGASALCAWLVISPTGLVYGAGIVADGAVAGHAPGVTQTGSGIPLVNIAAPNAAGISHNRYQSFNVDPVGAILNNSRVSGVSPVGEAIAANPNLGSRSASLIVNEVVSAVPSQLNGPLAVFGDTAQVVVANPNGITCNGCSFVNTSRATLSTGTPQWLAASGGSAGFDQASALALQVNGGQIEFTGQGLASSLSQLDAIAQTLSIDAPIDIGTGALNLLAGRQTVDQATLVQLAAGAGNTRTDIGAEWAIDASVLGAMNAGTIRIVATPAGMGVRSATRLAASSSDLTLSANGDLQLNGALAHNDLHLSSSGTVSSSDALEAGHDIDLHATRLDSHGQDIVAQHDANLDLLGNDAATLDNTGGSILAGNNLALTLQNAELHLDAASTGQIDAAQTLSIDADGILNSGSFSHAATLNLNARTELNNTGTIQAGVVNASAPSFVNSGTIVSQGNLGVASSGFANSGFIGAGNDATFDIGGSNAGGTLYAARDLALTTTQSGNLGGTVRADRDLALDFGDYTHGAGETDFNAGRDLTVNAHTLTNQDTLQATRDVNINAASVNNTGTIVSGQDININVGTLTNTAGTIEATRDLNIDATTISNQRGPLKTVYVNWGEFQPPGSVNCRADHGYCESWQQAESTPAAVLSAGRNLVTTTSGTLHNDASLITAGGDITLAAATFENTSHTLTTQWHGHWREWKGFFFGYKDHDDWGNSVSGNTTAVVQTVGTLAISAPTQTNNGNLIGSSVWLGGEGLTNGLTDYHRPTAATTIPDSIAALAVPPGAKFTPTGASLFSSNVRLSLLVPGSVNSLLPAELQNTDVPFLMDAWLEDQAIRQAALNDAGLASFLAGADPEAERAELYGNAARYAAAHGIKLGVALSPEQQASLTAPILWYVAQTVTGPDGQPYRALVPTLYLPDAARTQLAKQAGGSIQGGDVALYFRDSIDNTGFIQADTLSLATARLSNRKRSADIAAGGPDIRQYNGTQGYWDISGDSVQAGGFIAAGKLQLNARTIASISGEIYQNGIDQNPALAKALGIDFTQSTNADHIQQHWVQIKKQNPFEQVVVMAMAVYMSFVLGPEISGMIGDATGAAAGSTFAAATSTTVGGITTTTAAGLGNITLSSALTSMTVSAGTQLLTTGRIDGGQLFRTGLASGLTAGLGQGLGLNQMAGMNNVDGVPGLSKISQNLLNGNFSNFGTVLEGIAGRGLVNAGVDRLVNHSSFASAFKSSLISDASALGANLIGTAWGGGPLNPNANPVLQTVAHAGLGAISASLRGQDAVAGAIGGASESVLGNVAEANGWIDAKGNNTLNQQALYAGGATLLGGLVANAVGHDGTAAAQVAQNAAINNQLSRKEWPAYQQEKAQTKDSLLGNALTEAKYDALSAKNYATSLKNATTDEAQQSLASLQKDRAFYQEQLKASGGTDAAIQNQIDQINSLIGVTEFAIQAKSTLNSGLTKVAYAANGLASTTASAVLTRTLGGDQPGVNISPQEYKDWLTANPNASWTDGHPTAVYQVDLSTGSVNKQIVTSPSLGEELTNTLSLELVPTGKGLGNFAGAVYTATNDSYSQQIRNEAAFDAGANYLSVPAAVAMIAAPALTKGTAGSAGAFDAPVGGATSIATPYGPAFQSNAPAALNAINEVQQGAMLYRLGTLGQSQTAEAQFWSLQNPLTTPNYAGLYGIPPENVANANFIETAVLKPETPFITRSAPPVGTNPGGGVEVVVPSGGVQMRSFSSQTSN